MSALSIQPPFPIFTETDGQPLENGYIWLGTINLNPIVNPISAYWDAALTIAAVQPIRTLNGYPVYQGTPARIYVNSNYSIQVQNRNGSIVYSAPAATERYGGIINASDVVYDPAGTGAVATTVQTKLRESVSVKDFGAVGDGVTDDTAAIQAAINFCTNLSNRRQTLYFPAPNASLYYKTTAPLVISGQLNIVGDGEFSTTILAVGLTAGQFILDFDNLAANSIEFGGVSKITIRSNNALPTAIRLKNASYWTFKNVQLSTLTTGIYVTGTRCFSNFFEQVTGYAISSYTVQMDSFTGGGQYVFNGCTFAGSDGFYLTSTAVTDGLAFYGCNFEQCFVTDMFVAGTVSGLTISGCRSEGLDGATSFLINPSGANYVNGISITGCTWSTDFGNAYAVDFSGNVTGFDISGNYGRYIGLLGFVRLNGGGAAGVISGNYCENSPAVVSATRAGVVVYANYNSSGALPENWGTATWKVAQGSYTGSGTGFTTTPTATCNYSLVGNSVTLDIGDIFGTSNATTFTITGMPTVIQPSSQKQFTTSVENNGSGAMAIVRIATSGVITVYADLAGNGFVASGNKAIKACSVSYTLS